MSSICVLIFTDGIEEIIKRGGVCKQIVICVNTRVVGLLIGSIRSPLF